MPFIYPTSIELRSIQQDYVAKQRAGRLGLDILPPRNANVAKVRWTQKDNYRGLQNFRGMDGAPTRVTRLGYKTFEYEPGVFGEFETITETELTNRASNIDIMSVPIDISDLVIESDEQLIIREFDRMESSIWTLLMTGVLQIKIDGPTGIQQLGVNDAYTLQTFTAANSWLTAPTTSTPIKDFQTVQQLGLAVGKSVDFGAAATAYMNNFTAYGLLNNSNAADFGGRRAQYGSTLNSLVDVAKYWMGQNLPNIVTYDGGYYDDNNIFQKFIPNGKVLVKGVRPDNVDLGNYLLTRNANNGFQPGSYRYVKDRVNAVNAEKRTPADIEIHRGHNGGPTLYYPSAFVVMSV